MTKSLPKVIRLPLAIIIATFLLGVASPATPTKDWITSSAVVAGLKGFDMCNISSVTNMQTWWTNSPFYATGIYIGGVNRSCANTGLNSSWINQVATQGWAIIPTWVGPQAPCWVPNGTKMSSNTTTANQQGKNEADAAYSTMSSLGFGQASIVYYDIEAYDTSNTSCHAAVNAFLSGWDYELSAIKGDFAGIYGSTLGSDATSWASLSSVPDDVWLVAFDGHATTIGLTGISDSLWNNNQRIHQYIANQNVTYGGVMFQIDWDCLDGRTAANGWGTLGTKACS